MFVKFVPRELLYSTIAFLGEIPDENLPVAWGKYFIFDQMILSLLSLLLLTFQSLAIIKMFLFIKLIIYYQTLVILFDGSEMRENSLGARP